MARIVFVVLLLLGTGAPTVDAQAKRRVFVLHSGMHIILAHPNPDHAAEALKAEFLKRGIAKRDLVIVDSPFPRASINDLVPRAGLMLYLDSADPASRASQDGYVRLDRTLKAHGIGKDDDIVWIGHSAGGQIGMTMAYLAHHLQKFPVLARKTRSYHFHTVITLGTAFGTNNTPKDVRLRFYYSAGDTMIFFLSKNGDLVANSVKSKVRFRTLCEPAENVLTRVFANVEHPNWCHEGRIFDCMLGEFDPQAQPRWRKTHADAPRALALGHLFAHALNEQWRVSLEEKER